MILYLSITCTFIITEFVVKNYYNYEIYFSVMKSFMEPNSNISHYHITKNNVNVFPFAN